MTITGFLKVHKTLNLAIDPIASRTVPIPALSGMRDPFLDGCNLHRALRRLGDRNRLSVQERRFWPIIAQIRSELRNLGATDFEAEKPLREMLGSLSGRADLVSYGRPRLVIEVKVVASIPSKAAPAHLAQLGAYLDGVSHRLAAWRGVLLYLDLRGGTLRILVFEGANLAKQARLQLAA
jgi:hypothetical protein